MWLTRLMWSAYLAYQLQGQAKYPFRSPAVIQRDRERRVRAMVAHAYRHVPYYRQTMDRLGLRPRDFRGAADLSQLPLLEREQVQRDPLSFVSRARPPDRYLRLRSGGSTGAPRTVYHDTRALFQNAAMRERERTSFVALIGRSMGYRETVIASPLSTTFEVQEFCRQRSYSPRRARIDRQFLSLLEPPDEVIRQINAFRPNLLRSYGSYLNVLFPYLRTAGRLFHRPKVIFYTSDSISPSVRHLIEGQFGIPVFSTYQAIEAFRIAFECDQHRGLHVNLDRYPVRIVDSAGQEQPAGVSGDVVISNLVNRATVLLNYRLGDIAALCTEPCPCGRSLPLLSFLQGRTDDWLKLSSGRMVHPQAIRTIFTNEEEIWQYQVVHVSDTHFRILIMAGERCDRQQAQVRIAEGFGRVFGQQVTPDISFVDEIERTARGKVRPIISSVT
jgi:phenylacetate-CoA ligase